MNIELLAKVGVDQTNLLSIDSLEKMAKFYETLNKSLAKEKDNAKTDDSNPVRDEFRKTVSEDAELAEHVKNVVSEIRSILSDAMSVAPFAAILLSEEMKTLASEMSAEKNYQEAIALQDADMPVATVELPEDWSDRRNEAAEIADLIGKVFGLISADVKTAVEEKNTKFKVKASKNANTNFLLPDITKLVRDVKDDEAEVSLVGRAAVNSKIVYHWNGEVIETSMLNVVLHDYVSDFRSGYVITFSDLRDKVKEAGFDAYAKAAEVGTDLVFETGTLRLSMAE
jgi:hypothetical protein